MSYFSELKGKRMVITGGSKGIGRDIALAFAQLGTDVVITGRNKHDLQTTAEELKRLNPSCSYVVADVGDIESICKMMDVAVSHLGGVDILVNNAGINIAKPALEVTESDWDKVLDTNLKGMFFCSQQAGRYMVKQKQGSIVNIASQMAFVGYYDRAAYCSSKGGAVQLTKALAVEWASYNIRVNAVAPTFTETGLTSGMFQDKKFKEDVLNRILLGSIARPADVTGAVLFLASEMASFVTGETIRVDGGWTAI